jgi:hypothetical protein
MWETLAWSGSPFVIGALLGAAFARSKWSAVTVAAIGVLLGLGIVLWVYYSSPPSGAPYDGCSDCENYLGRWWEPNFVISLVVIGYFLWLFGVGVGVGTRSLLQRSRARIETSP